LADWLQMRAGSISQCGAVALFRIYFRPLGEVPLSFLDSADVAVRPGLWLVSALPKALLHPGRETCL
jgi:hypothetical protein